ncbi:MAG: MFS transporter [Verrucomicrobiae bacterium]|nr:MFS transporter [Verrucomicrobiae bacterium]NNJ85806.1 MFS transporter [Akkermansiaceae bacterium]
MPHANSSSAAKPVNLAVTFLKSIALLLLSAGVGWASAEKLGIGWVPGSIIGACIFGVGSFAMVKLAGSPREMGYTFGLKFLSVTAYKILNVTLVLWLVNDLGFTEPSALSVIVAWGFFMTITTLVVGSITDALGLRRTLILGVTLCVLTRFAMVLTTNKLLALGFGLFPLAVGEAFCTPVLVAAMRKYATPQQRSVAFSLFYAIMNFGFMFGYFVFDGVRGAMLDQGPLPVPLIEGGLSPFRVLLLVSLGVDLLMFPLILLLRPNVEMTADGLVAVPEKHQYPEAGFLEKIGLTVRDGAKDTWKTLSSLVSSDGFYRLICFLLIIGLLKVVFNAMDYVLPPFTDREIGEGAKVGRLNAVNGILILILAPAVGLMTRKYASYSMVILGGFITALSFVFMAMPTSAFQGAADGWLGKVIGHGYLEITGAVHPYYIMIFFWQVVFSIGEAFYSPRVYEYAASIAPKGQEATYSSLSYVPLLIGKLVTGAAFGGLLAKYCPEDGPRDPATMWLIIGLLILVAPVSLILFKRYIRVKEDGRGD